jgi:hypothetical protein
VCTLLGVSIKARALEITYSPRKRNHRTTTDQDGPGEAGGAGEAEEQTTFEARVGEITLQEAEVRTRAVMGKVGFNPGVMFAKPGLDS